jgi:hypothetical protein
MNIEKSIIISLYFNGSLNQEKTVNYFIELFENELFELQYSILDKTKSNWKVKSKGGKFTEKQFEKFKAELKNESDKVSIDFELFSNLKNMEYKSRDINLSISYNSTREIKLLNVILNFHWLNQVKIQELTESLCKLIENQNCDVVYGFISAMENLKFPAFYFQGISNENLTVEEVKKLSILASNLNKFNESIWDVFWGNLISAKHIRQITSLNKIEEVVGKENTLFMSPNLYWFNLNENLTDFDFSKYTNERNKLYDYFKSIGLIF